jgi:hypothetical protein
MAEGKDKCAHGPCSCAPKTDSKFCSEYCEDAEDAGVIEVMCGCAHAPCQS